MVHELIALYKSLGVSDQPSPTSIKSNSAYQIVMIDPTDSTYPTDAMGAKDSTDSTGPGAVSATAGPGAGVGEGKEGEEKTEGGETGAAGFVGRALAEAVAAGATAGPGGGSGGGGRVRGEVVVVEEDETGRDNVVPFLDAFR